MSARGDGHGGGVRAGIDCPRSSLLNARKAVGEKRLGWSVMIDLLDRMQHSSFWQKKGVTLCFVADAVIHHNKCKIPISTPWPAGAQASSLLVHYPHHMNLCTLPGSCGHSNPRYRKMYPVARLMARNHIVSSQRR